MADETLDYDQPKCWMLQADSDLILAQRVPEGVLLERRLFHAQQAVEKALKGVLVSRGLLYPRTHDIEVLIDRLREGGVAVPDEAMSAKDFTRFEAQTRYPVDFAVPPLKVTEEYCNIVAEIAAAVVEWAKTEIAKTEGDDN